VSTTTSPSHTTNTASTFIIICCTLTRARYACVLLQCVRSLFKLLLDFKQAFTAMCSYQHSNAICVCVHREELFHIVGRADGTLLHTAALHSRADCISLLLAARLQPTALNSAGQSALQLACVHCDVMTVQLLIEAGGWVSECSFDCLSNAVRAGSSEVLQLLISAAGAATATADTIDADAATAGGSNSSSSNSTSSSSNSSSSSSSSSISAALSCVQATTNVGGFTLMHAAAAARSLSCAEVLLRHGVDAAASGQVYNLDGLISVSALDLLVSPCPYPQLQPRTHPLAELEPAEFDKFALMLLSCGATIRHSSMSSDQYKRFAGALSKHNERQQQQARKRERLAALQAAACWKQSSSSSSSSSISDTVRVQLVHAVTKQTSSRVYTVETQLLTQLYANCVTAAADSTNSSCNSSSSSSSSTDAEQSATRQNVLLKLLVPPVGWQSSTTDDLKLISYDGKCLELNSVDAFPFHV
jgi:Ankyrin repeats (many copies)